MGSTNKEVGMGAYTPGPWRIGFDDGSGMAGEAGGAWIIGLDDEIVVAGGAHEGLKYGVPDMDNARLIAAAPDLLEAAKRAFVYFEVMAEKKLDEASPRVGTSAEKHLEPEALLLREAIAKAEGYIPE
jgi:hypothetical protein